MADFNPYAPPKSSEAGSHQVAHAIRYGIELIYFAWIVVFGFNLVVPLLFAWSMTEKNGRIGMTVAVIVLLAAGFWICAKARIVGRDLIKGGILVGLAQLFPILHIISGMVGMIVGQRLQLTNMDNETGPIRVNSELGGFIAALVTGTILMAMSLGTGFLIRHLIVTPWGNLGADPRVDPNRLQNKK